MKASTRGSSPRAAIILAGGEGLRMRSVTRFITGQEGLPKQFCPMMDGMTWFENTRNRVAQLIPRRSWATCHDRKSLRSRAIAEPRRPFYMDSCARGVSGPTPR
jgi:mannose-1-phosphate guanylyltransferase